jgi:membrane fusion protein (multidrug efflux system)
MSAINNSVSAYRAAPERSRTSLWSDKARLRKVLMFGGVGLFLAIAGIVYLMGGRFVDSDDSYIHANKLMVSTDVSGLIQTVNVREGQRVKAGDILFTLDPRPFQIALDNAKAELASTVQDVESTRAGYRAALGQIAAQEAQVKLDRATYNRYQALQRQNAIAAMQVDTARAAMLSAQATLASLRQTAATLLAKLAGNPDTPAEATPAYQKAKAQVAEMQRQLSHATVRAPFDGVVSEVDSLQPGSLVISAMSAFTTTSAVGLIGNDVWIESDLKETDLTHIHAGNPVDITIDTYPGHHWNGVVDNVSAGSDSAFSVLPAENGSGNWVKVVQRIPVRIKIEQKAGDPPLRAGMSAVVSIDTGKRRWQRMLNR